MVLVARTVNMYNQPIAKFLFSVFRKTYGTTLSPPATKADLDVLQRTLKTARLAEHLKQENEELKRRLAEAEKGLGAARLAEQEKEELEGRLAIAEDELKETREKLGETNEKLARLEGKLEGREERSEERLDDLRKRLTEAGDIEVYRDTL